MGTKNVDATNRPGAAGGPGKAASPGTSARRACCSARRGDRLLEPEATLNMNLIIPSEIARYPATRLFCVGRVNRIVEPDPFIRSLAFAASIVQHRLPVMTAPGACESAFSPFFVFSKA